MFSGFHILYKKLAHHNYKGIYISFRRLFVLILLVILHSVWNCHTKKKENSPHLKNLCEYLTNSAPLFTMIILFPVVLSYSVGHILDGHVNVSIWTIYSFLLHSLAVIVPQEYSNSFSNKAYIIVCNVRIKNWIICVKRVVSTMKKIK